MKTAEIVVFLLIFLSLILEFDYVIARGRGGSRGGRAPSRSRSPSSRRRSGGYRKPTIYKTTKMPVTTFKSPVIKSQTRYVSSSSKYPKYVAAGAVTYYALSYAPVYRGYYPMYGCHLRVPPNRGVRIVEERQEIVNKYTSEKCYQVTTQQANSNTASRDTSYTDQTTNSELQNPTNTKTAVVYDDGTEAVSVGLNDTDLDEDKLDITFNATTISDYDKDIVGTEIKGNCTRVVTSTRATMIRVYDTNPNANSALILPATSFVLLVLLSFISYRIL